MKVFRNFGGNSMEAISLIKETRNNFPKFRYDIKNNTCLSGSS